jgi:hypothetical protein
LRYGSWFDRSQVLPATRHTRKQQNRQLFSGRCIRGRKPKKQEKDLAFSATASKKQPAAQVQPVRKISKYSSRMNEVREKD